MSFIGRLVDVATSTDNFAADDDEVGKIISASISVSNEVADNTTNDDNGATTTAYSNYQYTIDLTCKYDYSDAGQLNMISEATSGRAGLYFRFQPQASVGEYEGIGLFRITSLTIDTSTAETEELSVTAESTGAVTWTAQT